MTSGIVRAYSASVEDDLRGAPSGQEIGEESVAKTEIKPARGRTFLPEVTGVEFSMARRGYDRAEVDQYVERISRIVVELEAMRSPDAVIERALADVGEETSSILRRARKAAEEIIADAEAHAGSSATQAEAEVAGMREDADRYAGRVTRHIEQLAQERHRLIEDLRRLADQFHRTADRALEQMPSADSSNGEVASGTTPAEAPA